MCCSETAFPADRKLMLHSMAIRSMVLSGFVSRKATILCSSSLRLTNNSRWGLLFVLVSMSQLSSCSKSFPDSIRAALFVFISALHPSEYVLPTFPGKAHTSRLYWLAKSAVISAPPFFLLSTTMVASERAAMMRLRRTNSLLSNFVCE